EPAAAAVIDIMPQMLLLSNFDAEQEATAKIVQPSTLITMSSAGNEITLRSCQVFPFRNTQSTSVSFPGSVADTHNLHKCHHNHVDDILHDSNLLQYQV